jgi:hypothetical protein
MLMCKVIVYQIRQLHVYFIVYINTTFNPVKELRNIRNLKSKSLYLRIIPRSTFNQPYEILFRTRNK